MHCESICLMKDKCVLSAAAGAQVFLRFEWILLLECGMLVGMTYWPGKH